MRRNYLLEYNYKDRLIVRTGYSYIYNSAGQALMNNAVIGNSYSIRFTLSLREISCMCFLK